MPNYVYPNDIWEAAGERRYILSVTPDYLRYYTQIGRQFLNSPQRSTWLEWETWRKNRGARKVYPTTSTT